MVWDWQSMTFNPARRSIPSDETPVQEAPWLLEQSPNHCQTKVKSMREGSNVRPVTSGMVSLWGMCSCG